MARGQLKLSLWSNRLNSSSLTCGVHCVRPADDVGVSLVELPIALNWDFAVIELLDVPRFHGHRFQLRSSSVLQCDDSVSPLDVHPGQHVMDQAVSFLLLTRHQSLGVTGAQEVRRLNRDGLGKRWKTDWDESGARF